MAICIAAWLRRSRRRLCWMRHRGLAAIWADLAGATDRRRDLKAPGSSFTIIVVVGRRVQRGRAGWFVILARAQWRIRFLLKWAVGRSGRSSWPKTRQFAVSPFRGGIHSSLVKTSVFLRATWPWRCDGGVACYSPAVAMDRLRHRASWDRACGERAWPATSSRRDAGRRLASDRVDRGQEPQH
jgi:hypothetical protein